MCCAAVQQGLRNGRVSVRLSHHSPNRPARDTDRLPQSLGKKSKLFAVSQAFHDCQEPGSAPEHYGLSNRVWATFTFFPFLMQQKVNVLMTIKSRVIPHQLQQYNHCTPTMSEINETLLV